MKVCPVCGARCFDDMSVCFGCLHNFDGEKQQVPREPAQAMMTVPAIAVVAKPSASEEAIQPKEEASTSMAESFCDSQFESPAMQVVTPDGWLVQVQVADFSRGVFVRCDRNAAHA